MNPIDDYRRQCGTLIARLSAQLATETSPRRRRHLHATILATRYGCTTSPRWEALLRADGTPRAGVLDAQPRPYRLHQLKPRHGDPWVALQHLVSPTNAERKNQVYFPSHAAWMTACDKTAAKRLHREIEGCRRALWLFLLWAGADVSSLRSSRYHPDEFMGLTAWTRLGRPAPSHTDYWKWAYRLLNDGEALDRLLSYFRGLLWAWSLRSKNKRHAGEALLHAAESLIDALATGVAA